MVNIFQAIYNLFYGAKDKQIADLQAQNTSLTNEVNALKANEGTIPQNLAYEGVITKDVPQTMGTVTYSEEIALIQQAFPNCGVTITDDYLQLTSVAEAQKFVTESSIQFRKYIAEKYNCNNFSASLYGYWNDALQSFAFGMARSSNHQYNIFIDNNKQVWIVEPQNATFYTIEQAKQISSSGGLNYNCTEVWM